jgi:hypothetical protein
MKTKLRRILFGIAAAIALLVAAVIVRFYGFAPRSRPAPVMTAPTNAEAIARGKYFAHHVMGCVGCHSEVDTTIPGEPIVEGRIGSGRDFGDDGSPVHIRAANITPDPDTGLGRWTDGEIARAIREGVSRDGRPLFPMMPYQTYGQTMSDGEVLDVIAYLRTLKPITNDPGRPSVAFPISMFVRTAPTPIETPPPPAPSPSDKKARGKWLLRVSSCNDCHDSVDDKMQKIPGRALAGGRKFPLPKGRGTVYTPNITSDAATGVGAYSDEDLRRAIDEGKGKDGRPLYVMPWWYYRGMTGEDKDALLSALRDVPAVANVVPASTVTR